MRIIFIDIRFNLYYFYLVFSFNKFRSIKILVNSKKKNLRGFMYLFIVK